MVVSVGMDGRMLSTPKTIQSGFSSQKLYSKMYSLKKKVLSSLIRKHPVITSWGEDALMQCKNGWRMVVHLWITTHTSSSAVKTKWKFSLIIGPVWINTHRHCSCLQSYNTVVHEHLAEDECFGVEKHLVVLFVYLSRVIFLINLSSCFCRTSPHRAVTEEILTLHSLAIE